MSVKMNLPFVGSLVEGELDAQVYQDVLKTFSRESITFLPNMPVSITNAPAKLIQRVQFSETEISPFHKHTIPCDIEIPSQRAPSQHIFTDQTIAFSEVKTLLVECFSPDKQGHRPYPSAGGLYPVEPLVFIFPDKISGFNSYISGCYHFRPISKKLQLIERMSAQHLFETLLHGYLGNTSEKWPNFAFLYLAHAGKALFKYRYRGYRQALMEAGSMYQQATLKAEQHGLKTTLWSTFSEPQMSYELGLDHATYWPLTMQLFGYGD